MACTVNVIQLTEDKFIDLRPWLTMSTKDNTVFISESMDTIEAAERDLMVKINEDNFEAVARTYANTWNKVLRELMPELSSGIYYPRMEFNSRTRKIQQGISIYLDENVEKELEVATARIMKERDEAEQKRLIKERVKELEEGNNYTNDGNLQSLEQLAKSNKIKAGDIKVENGTLTYVTKENPYLRDYTSTLTREEAIELFNRAKETEDYEQLAKYFGTYFVNEIVEKDPTLRLMYGRLEGDNITKPRILVVNSNKGVNPFTQYKNTIIVGLWQLEEYLKSKSYSKFESYENMIQKVAQEEAIHLLAEYMMGKDILDEIYSELSKSDINTIKKIYRNEELTKHQIVHEYLRMLVQNKLFGTTTDIEFQKLEKHSKNFLERLIEEILNFFDKVIGNNTTVFVEDIIAFAKEEKLSPKLIQRLENKVFDNPIVVESNLQTKLNSLYFDEEVLNYLYENSGKSKEFSIFVRELKQYVGMLRSTNTNEEIVEMLKCL